MFTLWIISARSEDTLTRSHPQLYIPSVIYTEHRFGCLRESWWGHLNAR